MALDLSGNLEVLFEEHALPHRVFDKIRRIDEESALVVDHKRLGAALRLADAVCETEPHHFKRNNHVLAGFRNYFRDPDNPGSRILQNAPPDIRRQHNGRPRDPLGSHPIVILAGALKGPDDVTDGTTTSAGEGSYHHNGEQDVVKFGPVTVDLTTHAVHRHEEAVHLDRLEFRILSMLTRAQGHIVTHQQILTEVWGSEFLARSHYIYNYMARLRRKLEDDPSRPRYIMTASSQGYRLSGLRSSQPSGLNNEARA